MNRRLVILAVVLILAFVWFRRRGEGYSVRDDWKTDRIDFNIARRVAGFFDTCSPENLEDCKRGRTGFEGLPIA
ncbi:hypothetical protein DSLPV1_179 [Dishui lake phycodnavirus 1]|uniref:hypothetical protein n=1 Tax=Dishui lake phycodnavirus 1 TaxID=2079134 RepID=UPI000CD675EA|nr:hypothetical protein C5Y57_gp219 [Dishui lake phycodnavirus 1]AUT19150.1 hypothetical protein DSLPV1_179 [Dishui lake phycodnavirus 1]